MTDAERVARSLADRLAGDATDALLGRLRLRQRFDQLDPFSQQTLVTLVGDALADAAIGSDQPRL